MKVTGLLLFFGLLATGTFGQAPQDTNIACAAYNDPQQYYIRILERPEDFTMHSENGCIFKLLDTLAIGAVHGDTMQLACLDKLYGKSDGEVSEYFLAIGVNLFYNGFDKIIPYLYQKKQRGVHTYLEGLIIESISMEISDAPDQEKEKAKINSFISEKEQKLSPQEFRYITMLQKKFNPEIFD